MAIYDGYTIQPARIDGKLAFRTALRPIYSDGSDVCGRCFRRDKRAVDLISRNALASGFKLQTVGSSADFNCWKRVKSTARKPSC